MTDSDKKAISAAALLAPGLAPPHLAVFREDGKWDSVIAQIAGPGDSVMEVSGSPSSVIACVERWNRANEQQEE